jgi:hypothetical protein
MSAPWSTLLELDGMTEADKKLILKRVAQEIETNPQIRKILRRSTKALKDRLKQKQAPQAENVTTLKKREL